MAKIEWLGPEVEGLNGVLELSLNSKHTKATFQDSMGGEVVMFGSNLKMEAGELVGGKVNKILFVNNDGDDTVLVSKGDFNAAKIGEAADSAGAYGIYLSVFGGNDQITGTDGHDALGGEKGNDRINTRGGADDLYGGRGNDVLTGGKGSDDFHFENSDGVFDDRITDFQTDGVNADHLVLEMEVLNIKSVGGGQDAKVFLENGATILFEGVTRQEFEEFWFS